MTDFDSCYAMREGKLVLRGIVNQVQPNDTAPYLTGGVYTKGKKAFINGRIEICAKLNAAKGAWPAIWMLPEKAAWPSGGEIDIMERLNNDSIAYQTVHSHYTYTLGITENPKSHSTGPIYPDRYNVYAVEMYPDSLSFYINDMHTFTYPPRLLRIAFTFGSSIASCKSFRRWLIVPAYRPDEPPACFPITTFTPHDSIRFRKTDMLRCIR